MNTFHYLTFALIVLIGISVNSNAQVATGGGYTLEHSVVGNGGGSTGNAQYSINSTAGQPAAGSNMVSMPANYSVRDGFWANINFGPTASQVSVSGRILTAGGLGINNTVLTLSLSDGTVVGARSSSLGYYRFDGIAAGQSGVLTVHSKRFAFAQPSRVVTISQDIGDLDFIAEP